MIIVENIDEEYGLEDLISAMAHEIKNPIALIKANVDYLMISNKDLVEQKNLVVINNQLDRLNELTDEYTYLMKYSNERKINVCLHDLLYSAYSDYKESYKDIKFEFICDDKEVYVHGNFMLLDIAVRNLLKNSVEAIENGGDKITIKLIRTNEISKIVIEDNGGGFVNISEEEAKEKFKTTKKGGTGLGLFITDYIIKDHNGYFELLNSEKGCTAIILL